MSLFNKRIKPTIYMVTKTHTNHTKKKTHKMPKKELYLAPHPQAISELSIRTSIQNVDRELRAIDKDYWPHTSQKIFSTKNQRNT